jgi:hypothetical protein
LNLENFLLWAGRREESVGRVATIGSYPTHFSILLSGVPPMEGNPTYKNIIPRKKEAALQQRKAALF